MRGPVRRAPWWAFLLHRLSGLALAVFLPFHFLVLGLAVERAALDGVLDWAASPWVKLAEAGLVGLLALHLAGGLRLLLLEFARWSDGQQTRIWLAAALALLAGCGFLAGAFS